MPLKTYVLMDHLNTTAPISIQLSKKEAVRLTKLPVWEPFLQVTFANEKGENRTIRLKLNTDTPYQDEQITKGIPANAPFTTAERNARKFINGSLTTGNLIVQKFLEASPYMYGFNGYCSDITGPAFKLYEPDLEIKSSNQNFKKRLKAANKINDLDLKGAQDMLIRIFGISYQPSDDIDEAQNALVAFMDSTPEEGINEILRGDINLDDEAQIMIGRLVHAGVLSFVAVQDQVVKKGKDGRWINLKAVPAEYSDLERERYFSEFLTSVDGKLLMRDLKSELEAVLNPPAIRRQQPIEEGELKQPTAEPVVAPVFAPLVTPIPEGMTLGVDPFDKMPPAQETKVEKLPEVKEEAPKKVQKK